MKRKISAVIISIFLVTMLGCQTESPFAKVEVWLTDAPGEYEKLRIEILGVEAHKDRGDQPSGWMSFSTNAGLYDVLELTNGREVFIASMQVPTGKLSQLRLKLSNRNSLVVYGETYALRLPESHRSGIIIPLDLTVGEGGTHRILLDYDVARSVIEHGNGSYEMQPVIRVIQGSNGGVIAGRLSSSGATAAIYVVQGDNTITSTYPDDSGRFAVKGLGAGTYTVVFSNADGSETRVGPVTVNGDKTTDLGTISAD